jgi:transposase
MNEEKPQPVRYPLLESMLAQMNLPLRGTYTNRHVAEIFEVSVRTIQDWVRRGQLVSRNLPGRGKFLSEDLENLLKNSVRRQRGETEAECE